MFVLPTNNLPSNVITRVLLLLLCISAPAMAQRVGGAYDCDEELFPRYDKQARLWGYVNMVGTYRVEPFFEKATRFEGRSAIVQKGTLYGLVNCEGRLAIPALYDQILPFASGRGWVRKGPAWGLFEYTGKPLVSFTFSDVRPVTERSELAWVKKGERWGLFSKDRVKMIIEPRYDAFRSVSDSLGLGLEAGGLSSLIYLKTGQIIYDSVTRFERVIPNRYLFTYQGRSGLIDPYGNVRMRPDYQAIEGKGAYFTAKWGGQYHLYDFEARQLTKTPYDSLLPATDALLIARRGTGYGYLLANGKDLLPCTYQQTLPPVAGSLLVQKAGKWAITLGKPLSDSQFRFDSLLTTYRAYNLAGGYRHDTLTVFALPAAKSFVLRRLEPLATGAGLAIQLTGTKKIFYLARQAMSQEAYTEIEPLTYPYMRAKVDASGPYKLLDLTTQAALGSQGPDLHICTSGGQTYVASQRGAAKLTTVKGALIGEIEADSLLPYKRNVLIYKRKGKYGFINIQPFSQTDDDYDFLRPLADSGRPAALALAQRKGKFYLVDEKGKAITEEYPAANYIGAGYVRAVRKDIQVDLLSSSGKVLKTYPPDGPLAADGRFIMIGSNGVYSLADKAGNSLFAKTFAAIQLRPGRSPIVRTPNGWQAISRKGILTSAPVGSPELVQ